MVDLYLLPLAIFFIFCSTIGVIGNTIMILCCAITKRLRSPCHFLISLTCLIDAFHISGQYPFIYQFFTGFTSSQSECYFMLILPIIGYTAGGPLILAMGIDRFIAVTFPTSYRYYQQSSVKYLALQLIFPTIYTSFFLVFGFLERDINEQITCANPLALKGASFQWYNYTCAFIYVAIFFVYFRVYFLLKHSQTILDSRFKSVFRSILVTVSFVLLGWATTTIANSSSYSVTDNLDTAHLIQTYAGITVNFAAASNVFVFYSINSEYREAIQKLFGRKSKKLGVAHTETSTTQDLGAHSSKRSKSLSVLSMPKFFSSSKLIPKSSRRMTLVI
ncbi:CRE-SRSX-26 protein [Caenorhabditis remanei]|uniref:CRE-SRSX-26 protein n=1 Tax=Caenorhabditis remanei TaxID=31234 RepID=E3LTV1_CAERE|nr:CRE-SRSX-26 protein [Caenorhabditis remanei]